MLLLLSAKDKSGQEEKVKEARQEQERKLIPAR